MNRLDREWEIKLDLLASIARSQKALASILESTADVMAVSGIPPAVLHEHVRVLDGMQAALLRAATGTSWRPPQRGKPGVPWLNNGICSAVRKENGGILL